MLLRHRLTLSAALASALLSAGLARAESPRVEIKAPGGINQTCGPRDPDCRRTILLSLKRPHIHPVTIGEGVTFGSAKSGTAIRFGYQLAGIEQVSGDGGLLMFDAAFLSEGGFRVRFIFADAEALFTCTGLEDGKPVAIGAALTKTCKPDEHGARAIVGVGGRLGQVQWDQITNRVAARWAEIHGVLNLLANANDKEYLQRKLQLYAGASLDTIWYGSTPGTEGGRSTMPRYDFGISGMVRSDDNHMEINGLAGFRQNLLDPSDYSIETRAQALYNILYSDDKLMHVGLDFQYQYNSVPANSMGDLVSDREKRSAYFGAVLGFKFD